MVVLIVILLLVSLSCLSSEPLQAKRFTINLDLPPQQRWLEVMQTYQKTILVVERKLRTMISYWELLLLENIALHLEGHFPWPYADELRGIAKAGNTSLAYAVLVNMVYDFTAYGGCTSIVAQDKDGNIFHARNLDYVTKLAGDLRKLTFIADFQSKGKTVYSGVTFASMIGLVTAQRPGAFTISLNQRNRGNFLENILMAILNNKALPVAFEIRKIIATNRADFNQAVKMLSNVILIAGAYFIVGGVKAGEGAVITRDRFSLANLWKLDSPKRWFLVETNYDHWTTPPPKDHHKHETAVKALTKLGQENINGSTLFGVLSMYPILRNGTVYTTIMEAKNAGLFNTWIQLP